MNWLKNVIKNALRELIKEDSMDFAKRSTEHIVLDPDCVNVLTIDCGQMPFNKAREYLEKLSLLIRKEHKNLKLVLIAK
jgi:hypothetical protein